AGLILLGLHDGLPVSAARTESTADATCLSTSRSSSAAISSSRLTTADRALARLRWPAMTVDSFHPTSAPPSSPIGPSRVAPATRSEEHTSELQSRENL